MGNALLRQAYVFYNWIFCEKWAASKEKKTVSYLRDVYFERNENK